MVTYVDSRDAGPGADDVRRDIGQDRRRARREGPGGPRVDRARVRSSTHGSPDDTYRAPLARPSNFRTNATYDYIEVAGTLRVSRTHDTQVRFTHLINLPGGTIDVGTQADPIPCDRRVEFVIRNVPIDTAKDPFQWGNGLINFGHQTRVGCRKTAFLEATDSLAAGATRITLASAPVNWQVGDELLIPDTAQPAPTPRREARVTIAAINGADVTLSKRLDFAHPTITDPNGVVVLRPRVANLTRNIVVRSEEPLQARRHARPHRGHRHGRRSGTSATTSSSALGERSMSRWTTRSSAPTSAPISAGSTRNIITMRSRRWAAPTSAIPIWAIARRRSGRWSFMARPTRSWKRTSRSIFLARAS